MKVNYKQSFIDDFFSKERKLSFELSISEKAQSLSETYRFKRKTILKSSILGLLTLSALTISYELFYCKNKGINLETNLPICPLKIVTGYQSGNLERDVMSEIVISSQEKYAQKYGYLYNAFTENLAKKCKNFYGQIEECQPQWSKIAIIKNWLEEPKELCSGESWIVWLDDDMPITNPSYRLETIIEQLRENSLTSLIVTRDPQNWHQDRETSVNTGALFVRNDLIAKKIINAVWNARNTPSIGGTLGTCKNQVCLHEQEALANFLKEGANSYLKNSISIVEPRKENIGVNTLARSDEYYDIGRGNMHLNFKSDLASARWKPGDFAGQCSGLPIKGYIGAPKARFKRPKNIRLICVKKLIESSKDFSKH